MPEIPTLEAAPEGADFFAPPPRKRSWLTILILWTLLLSAAGAAAWYWWLAPADAQKVQKAPPPPVGPPIYVALDPPFVVNFEAQQLVRFLQITVQVMSRDPHVADLVKANDPVIRNDLLLLFANQRYEVIATREGKEKLRAEALETVRKVITSAGGKGERVEAVYFTSFVMQ